MQMIMPLSAALLLAIFATNAAADEFPPRKPGAWEITTERAQHPGLVMKMCVDKETDELFHKLGAGLSQKVCDRTMIKLEGHIVTAQAHCTIGGSTMTSTSVTRFDGDKAYHMETKSHFAPAFMGRTDSVTSQDAKWVGECPPDMKPGDFSMGHGVVMNIKMLGAIQDRLPHK